MGMHRITHTAAAVASHLALLVLTVSCGIGPQERPDVPQLVVQGFLTPGKPVTGIEIRHTLPPDEYYEDIHLFEDREKLFISGALVTITHRDSVYRLAERTDSAGVGVYENLDVDIVAGETYRLEVRYEDPEIGTHHVRAETTVPHPVTHQEWELSLTQVFRQLRYGFRPALDTLIFPKELADPLLFPPTEPDVARPFELRWEPSPDAAAILVGAQSRDTSGAHILRDTDWERWLVGDLQQGRMRAFTRTNGFAVHKDTTSADIFWALIRYSGPFTIGAMAIDRNYWDYYRTTGSPSGPDTGNDWDAGTRINIEGGVGVFGSYAWPTDTLRSRVEKEYDPVTRRLISVF